MVSCKRAPCSWKFGGAGLKIAPLSSVLPSQGKGNLVGESSASSQGMVPPEWTNHRSCAGPQGHPDELRCVTGDDHLVPLGSGFLSVFIVRAAIFETFIAHKAGLQFLSYLTTQASDGGNCFYIPVEETEGIG